MGFHRFAQELVDPSLVPFPVSLEPRQNIGIQPNGQRLLDRPVELADDGLAPVRHFGNIGEIDHPILHPVQCRDLPSPTFALMKSWRNTECGSDALMSRFFLTSGMPWMLDEGMNVFER